MKCLMYVSESTSKSTERVPADLTTILQSSRLRNKKNEITGVLSYRNKRYFQIIEGEDAHVDELFTAIKADSRHQKIWVVLDIATDVRSFPRWPLKLVPALSDEIDVLRFLSKHAPSLEKIPPVKLDMLSFFFEHSVLNSSKNGPRKGENLFMAYDLMLDDWPNFSKVAPSNQLIEVCSELVRGATSYYNLIDKVTGSTEEQVVAELDRLDELGLLVKIPSRSRTANRNTSIYTKLRTFLSKPH